MEVTTRARTREENKSLNLVASEFEIKSKTVKSILSELNSVTGLAKNDVESIKLYADYISLRKKNKISVGNAHILINCSSNRNYADLIKVICKILYKQRSNLISEIRYNYRSI